MSLQKLFRERPFAYSEIFIHPPLPGAAFEGHGQVKSEIDPFVATVCKNESNVTAILKNGTWFTTWSQGSAEHGQDERIVYATSEDMGQTWTRPVPILQSSPLERVAYGFPFVVPETGRIYLIFHSSVRKNFHYQFDYEEGHDPFYDAGRLGFVYSDNHGGHWSPRFEIPIPNRDIHAFRNLFHGWVNHPPIISTSGEVLFAFTAFDRRVYRRAFMLHSAEVSVIRCDNILSERDPRKLVFSVRPEGPRGIRVDVFRHANNPSVERLIKTFGGYAEDSTWNFQEMTLVSLSDGRLAGVGRCSLGSPAFSVSADGGETWSPAEPLRYRAGGELIRHPMTMCPITRLEDGRILLFITDNDGFQRGATHVWEGNGKTRNPQFFCVGVEEKNGQKENAGLNFSKPRLLAEVTVGSDSNLKTGVSMPHAFMSEGRVFVGYNINKEHLVLDEIPLSVIDSMTPHA